MGFEIDFLPVGDGSKAGDAIVVRHDMNGTYEAIIIDGGTDAAGERLVSHVNKYFGPDTAITDVILTHPDTDHSCGLRHVLKELPVQRLWLHGLWYHAAHITEYFKDSRWGAESLSKTIKAEYPVVAELIDIAHERGIDIREPFAGTQIGPFTVLSPDREVYRQLIPQFRKTPDPDQQLLTSLGTWVGKAPRSTLLAFMEAAMDKIVSWVDDDKWDVELLREGGVTAAENESSVVLFGQFDTGNVLLTADAGNHALNWAADQAARHGFDLHTTKIVQIPHHGSRRNVSPSALNRIVGPIVTLDFEGTRRAVVSAPKDDSTHPRRIVLNAFKRRGTLLRSTQGSTWHYGHKMPDRPGWGPAEDIPFFTKVEAYD